MSSRRFRGTDGQTDGQTDGRTDRRNARTPPHRERVRGGGYGGGGPKEDPITRQACVGINRWALLDPRSLTPCAKKPLLPPPSATFFNMAAMLVAILKKKVDEHSFYNVSISYKKNCAEIR